MGNRLRSAVGHIGLAAACWAAPSVAQATTFNTIQTGGPPIPPFGFVADETFVTSTAARVFHCTWDADFLFLAQLGEPVNPSHLPQRRVAWYFDTDPQPSPLTGAGTASALSFGTQNWTLPFRADYAIVIRMESGYGFYRWDGTAWIVDAGAGSWVFSSAGAPPYLKTGIPRTLLGSPASIYALGFLFSEEAASETTYASWPDDSLIGGDGYKPAGVFAHWFGFPLGSGISPNDPQYHDQTLPVELMGFAVE